MENEEQLPSVAEEVFEVGDLVDIHGHQFRITWVYLEAVDRDSFPAVQDIFSLVGILTTHDADMGELDDPKFQGAYNLCREAYGYEPETNDSFPEFKPSDTAAAGRLIQKLRSMPLVRIIRSMIDLDLEISGYSTQTNGDTLWVGCNTIPFTLVEETYLAMKKYRETGIH